MDSNVTPCRSPFQGKRRILFLLASMLVPLLAVAGEEEAHAWIERMINAVRTLNYEGTFVYLRGGHLESIRITHSVEGGEERERLLSLNGSPRMVNRDQASVVCIMPDVHDVSVEKRRHRSGIPVLQALGEKAFPDHYVFRILGKARIAGQDAAVIGIIPKDDYRYGYRLFLDRETALPLKLDLMDESANPIEQVMFTSLRVLPGEKGVAVADEADEDVVGTVDTQGTNGSVGLKWRFRMLPPGFSLKVADDMESDAGHKVEHLVVSDGFASVSVYIEPFTGDGKALTGSTSIGAVNALGGKVAGFQVTAVGEVPRKTIREVVEAMEYVSVASVQ